MVCSVDSQTHSWHDLDESQKLKAYDKALQAYHEFDAWHTDNDMDQEEFDWCVHECIMQMRDHNFPDPSHSEHWIM